MQQKGSRQRYSADRVLNSASYIRLDGEKLSPQHAIFQGIEFRLAPDVLAGLHRARARGERLRLPSPLLTEIREYALGGEAIAFSTFYREGDREEIVLRSRISLEGEITHQVCRHYLDNAPLLYALSASHHWLIQQILRRLNLPARRRVEWLSWLLAVLIVAAIGVWRWQSFPVADPVSWIIVLAAIWLFHLAIAFLFKKLRLTPRC